MSMVLNMLQDIDRNAFEDQSNNLTVVLNVWGNDDPISLVRSLQSIKAQVSRPQELIVIVDGPINGDLENSIQQFHDQIQQIIRIPVAKGLWNGRNIGIATAKTEFVALHDADDVMHPLRLAIQLKEIEDKNADVVVSSVYEFDSETEQIIGLRELCDNTNLTKKMRWQNVINHSSVMLRKSAFVDVGGYRNVHLAEDYDLWIRMIQNKKTFICTSQVLQAFSVDRGLTKRRGGFEFIHSEFAINNTLSGAFGMKVLERTLRLIARIIYRIGPGVIRKLHRKIIQVKKQNTYDSLADFLAN